MRLTHPLLAALCALISIPFAPTQAGAADGAPKKERLVVMGGPITEIVFALGAEADIVATDRTSLYPERAQKLPSVGVYRAISVEGVLSVNPTKIISGSGLGPAAAVKQLKTCGIPLVIVENPKSAETLFSAIEILGREVSREKEATALAAKIRAQFAEVKKLTLTKPAPRVVFLMGMGGSASAAGTGTQADGIVTLAGGNNLFSEFRGYKQISEEALLKAAPDIILVASHTTQGDVAAPPKPKDFLARLGFKSVGALGKTKVVPIDIGEFLIIGPRAGDTTLKLAKIFYEDTPAADGTVGAVTTAKNQAK
ncbi:MAG: ABC transporter substrate-binding protein [Puniceicoccales bacterium]|jgi:iron complex transport system substrate-binding protein|nr:ABC transporter substrate-binding protein [Puniceicoccales bacterium]